MTNTLKFRGLILSLLALGVIAATVGGATVAFYSDVERSTGNTFTAGGVELKVDSVSHYNGLECILTDEGYLWLEPGGRGAQPDPSDAPFNWGQSCGGTWAETDLEDGVHKFFNFLDLKPGDYGEDTISLHVYDNPAWGRLVLENIIDRDNTCTDPEQEAEDGACSDPSGDGEIDNYLRFTGWVDQGATAGFQCGANGPNNAECNLDPTEGDNIFQEADEGPAFWDDALIGDIGPFDLAPVLAAAYQIEDCSNAGQIDGDTDYTECMGYAEDGRMVPSTTYYFGLAWDLDLQETGNDAQTDTYGLDMVFEVEQYRNNPNPFPDAPIPPVTTVVQTGDIAVDFADVGANPEKWFFYNDSLDTIDNTLGAMVAGPSTPPAGTGSVEFTLAANPLDRKNIATYQFGGTVLDDVSAMSYSAYSVSGVAGPNESAFFNFNVDFDGSDTWQNRLVYVPSVNGAVPQDSWNTHDMINGGVALWTWSKYVGNGNMWPDGGVDQYRTWNDILASFPGVRVRVSDPWLGVRVGEPGPTGYTGNVDLFSITINGAKQSFDFEN